MNRLIPVILAATAILGCERSQPPTVLPSPSSPAPGGVAPGTALSEGDFQKTLQATQARFVLATVFAVD